MKNHLLDLPQTNTLEAKRERKNFIITFYSQWITLNSTKQVFNKSLNDFINVHFLSIQETAGHASHINLLLQLFISQKFWKMPNV